MKEGGRTAGRGRRAVTFSNALLIGQVAFSLICLVTSALFFRSIQRAYTLNPGFETDHLALFMMNPEQAGYGTARAQDFYREIKARVASQPGVAVVSWASALPFWNAPSNSVVIESMEQRAKSKMIPSVVITTDTGYFNVMELPLVRGRVFAESDGDNSQPVTVINEELAHERWPGGEALGHRLQLSGDKTFRQVIGIVANANYTTIGESPQPCVYLPLKQKFSAGMTLYVQAKSDPKLLLNPVAAEVRKLDSKVAVTDSRTGSKLIEQVLWGPKIGVALLGVFGSLAMVLASAGLYGVMAYSLNRRTTEIGIRMALGASRPQIMAIVVRDGLMVVACGIVIGLGACLLTGHVLSKLLLGIGAADPLSLGAATLLMLLVAGIACYFPARSATRIDTMAALRDA